MNNFIIQKNIFDTNIFASSKILIEKVEDGNG